jgi:hypothetical protein
MQEIEMTDGSVPKTGINARLAKIAKNTEIAEKRKREEKELLGQLESELASEKPVVKVQIPLFPEDKSAMPTKWTRTSLFAAVKKGRRRSYVKTLLASRDGTSIRYSGEQLDAGDNDVFLHAMRLAQGTDTGGQIHFVRSHFLQAIGRKAGTSGYKWLKDSLERLGAATLFIEDGPERGKMVRLVKELSWRESEYWLALDPEIASFYGRREIAFIDFDARLRMTHGMSRLLQNYVVGHQQGEWHYAGVDDLRDFYAASSTIKTFMDVRHGLPAALAELEALGLIEDHEFYLKGRRKMVKWWRPSDFGKWLRSYVNDQHPGWHHVAVEDLFGSSKYRTLKSFLSPSKGLKRGLHELEKAGVISKPEIYQEKAGEALILKVRWHLEK